MTMPRKHILLALDGSDASLETVHYVAKIFPVAPHRGRPVSCGRQGLVNWARGMAVWVAA